MRIDVHRTAIFGKIRKGENDFERVGSKFVG